MMYMYIGEILCFSGEVSGTYTYGRHGKFKISAEELWKNLRQIQEIWDFCRRFSPGPTADMGKLEFLR